MRSLSLLFLIVFSQVVNSQPIMTLEGRDNIVNLATSAVYLEDSTGGLQIVDVVKPEKAAQFKPVNKQSIAFGLTPSFFWIKAKIINRGNNALFLKISNNSLTDIKVFELVNTNVEKYYHTGNWLPFNKREIKNIDHLISLHALENQVSEIYIRVMHVRGTQFPVYIGTATAFYTIDTERGFVDGIYYGLMLLMVLYNLFIYFSLRDKSYLYYVVYVLLIAMLNASMDGYAFRYFWPAHPYINQYEDIWASLSGIAAIIFTSSFLNIKQTSPVFHKIFKVILFTYILSIALVLTKRFSIGMIATEVITLIFIFCIFTAAYIIMKNGYKPAKLFLLAWSMLLLSAVVFILKDYGFLLYNALTVNALQIGSAVEVLMLSIALADRINTYRREKAKAQKELIESLQEKSTMQHDMLELEATALRSQMNPHFIFNCINSIKALIKQQEDTKAIDYLTTFSKLLRTILSNAEKRTISLFDEIETCRLYIKLESMRFQNKFSYSINIDEGLDLKSIEVPALILQPFIENAIWHGLLQNGMPGTLNIMIEEKQGSIQCTIDDNGIGREQSLKNKVIYQGDTHQSRGINLTQSRLNIDNALSNRNAAIEIFDKTNATGQAIGTTVILTFKEY